MWRMNLLKPPSLTPACPSSPNLLRSLVASHPRVTKPCLVGIVRSSGVDCSMIRLSIRRKIMGIAIALIVLMTITAILSMAWVIEVGARLQELTNGYIPAYGSLARTNIRSLERSLALRRSVIEEIQSPSSDKIVDIRKEFDAKGIEVEREAQAARALIHDLTEKGETFGNATALARLETRIDSAMADTRRELNAGDRAPVWGTRYGRRQSKC